MNLLVYGAQEFGQVVCELIQTAGHNFVGFIDDFHEGGQIRGNWDTIVESFAPSDTAIAIAVGYRNLTARWSVFEKVRAAGFQTPTVVHPSACVAETAVVNDGTFVMAGTVLDCRCQLEELVVAWPGVIVNHDSTIARNTFLSPGAIVCGATHVGSHSFVGAGATIVDHVKVPNGSFIKAGTVYTERTAPARRRDQ